MLAGTRFRLNAIVERKAQISCFQKDHHPRGDESLCIDGQMTI